MPSTLYLNNEESSGGIGGLLVTMGAYLTMYGVSEAIEMLPLRSAGYYDNWKKIFGFGKVQKGFRQSDEFVNMLNRGKYGRVGTKMFDPNLFDVKMDKDYRQGRQMMKDFYKTDASKSVGKFLKGVQKLAKTVNVVASFEGTELLFELGEMLINGLFINPLVQRGKALALEEKMYFTDKKSGVQTSLQQLVQSQLMNMYRLKLDQEIMNTYLKIQENQRSKSVENPYVMYRYY